jgi:hypothetical protein
MNELNLIRTLLAEAPPSAEVIAEGRRRIAGQPAPRRRRPPVRWGLTGAGLAAAAAAAAVITLAATAGTPGTGPGASGGPSVPPGLLLAAAVTKAPPASAAARGMPPFYVVADHNRPVADVRDSATGRLVGTVPLPAGTDPKLTQATAAGNDRMFVLSLFSRARGTQFYGLQITASGQPAALVRLGLPPLPAGEMADAIALTPDGTRLAVAIQIGGQRGKVEVITLATGAARTWTTARGGLPEALSWDAAGQRLSFFWTSNSASSAGLWLLDTSAPGSELLSGRRVLPQTVGPDEVQSALISPDARTVIASVTYNGTTQVRQGTVVGGIVEVSAQTGRPLRTLLAVRSAHSSDAGWYITGCLLQSLDATGNHLLLNCDQFGRLDRGRFTALPGAAPQTAVAAAW